AADRHARVGGHRPGCLQGADVAGSRLAPVARAGVVGPADGGIRGVTPSRADGLLRPAPLLPPPHPPPPPHLLPPLRPPPAAPAASAAPLRLLIDREPREPTANFEYRPRIVKVDRVSGDGYSADASRNAVDRVSVRSRGWAGARS